MIFLCQRKSNLTFFKSSNFHDFFVQKKHLNLDFKSSNFHEYFCVWEVCILPVFKSSNFYDFFHVWEGSNLTVFKSSNFHDVFAHNRRVWCYSFQVWGPTDHLSWWVLQSLKEFQDRHSILHKSILTVKGGQNQTGGSSRKWSAFTTSSNKIIRNDGKAVLTWSHNLKVRWIISKKRPKEYKQVSHLLRTNWFLIQANDCIPNPTWMWSLCRGNKQTDEICMWRKGIYMFLLTHLHVENNFPSSLSSSDES